jgi:molybdopterin-guanine dinucleotide biosynthesis protein A
MIKGLILAGGRSSRMGRDKSLMAFHGKPQREHLFDLLSTFCIEVHLSCKNCHDVPKHLNPLPDQYNVDSPINGVLSAFSLDPFCAWLAVAVDMPFIDAATLQYLLDRRDPEKVATCFLDSDGKKPEPLLTLWEPKAFPFLQSYYDQGKISPRDFLIMHEIQLITAPNRNVFTNINSPDDLKQFDAHRNN